VHKLAIKHGLRTKSRGKGFHRAVTVYKREMSAIIGRDAALDVGSESLLACLKMLSQFPLTAKERQDLTPATERERSAYVHESECNSAAASC